MIKPWIFTFLEPHGRAPTPFFEPERCQQTYAWYLDFWPKLEGLGFEGLFFSEHHFGGNLSPSPNLLIAAVAMKTQTLRLGVMGQVLPLHRPWRVAEEIGMLDHISGGRLEIGYSSGAGPRELVPVGISETESRPRFEESLEIIDTALANEVFSHEGKFWTFKNLSIAPRPLQQPSPPKWMTVRSAGSAAMAAKRGYKICTGFVSNAEARAITDAYHETSRAAGRSTGPDQIGLRRQVFIWDNAKDAAAIAAEAVEGGMNQIRDRIAARQARGGQPIHAPLVGSAAPDRPNNAGFALFTGPDESITGTVNDVAEQVIDQCRKTGTGNFLSYLFGKFETDQITRCYELWRQVIPILRKAEIT